MQRDGKTVPFEIRGVNMGVGLPGEWATDYAIDKETYLRWFEWIQEMGANTIRVYTILQDDFYNAFYEYNTQREQEGKEPLWLLHGVWVNDYVQNSHRDAYDDDFRQTFLDDCRTLVDILHGKKNLRLGYGLGSGSYRKDISQWVIGYILGVEWEDVTVAYTDHKYPDRNVYEGTYMYTTEEASPFEAMLCEVGDKIIEYESNKYKQQRLVAFSNWPTTDPFYYSEAITRFFSKCARVDVEHIQTTEAFLSGQFASYHVYPYYPDYLNYETDITGFSYTDDGHLNTYLTYLKRLTEHHNIPVVISEYGVSTGRGMAQRDVNTGRNQGNMSEQEQGQAVIECYEDIMEAGCAGSCVFTWQDEWFKRTWNTMHAVDLQNTPYWSDYQTNEQYFGLLAFDPGEEESVSYVDGDTSEWKEEDRVIQNGDLSVSMKYDEKFVYFFLEKDGFNFQQDTLYLPIDITPKTGSTYCENYDISFDRASDFIMVIDGKENSRLLVQERYEVLRAMYSREISGIDAYVNPVDKDSPVFKQIHLMLQMVTLPVEGQKDDAFETYETGCLTYGNANPESEDFNSLADFMFTDNGVEIRIPWQLLNFGNPSEMMVHDDYYENYGVEYIHIDEMYVGIADSTWGKNRIPMESFPLEGWGKDVTYHERLKESYYMLKDYWSSH
ncbi:MAG: family 2 glycosyl transferase [Massiliimalia sp.]